jgi:alkaline phosphatase D
MSDDLTSSRRAFMAGTVAGSITMTSVGDTFITRNGDVHLEPWVRSQLEGVTDVPTQGTRPWLGPAFWANRLQDWRRNGDRLECLRDEPGYELRTVGILTREVNDRNELGHIRVITGIEEGADQGGFCGFLIGIGGGKLDYRAAALAQRGSGTGGGILCTFGTDGRIQFREHTNEARPLAFEKIPTEQHTGPKGPQQPTKSDHIKLALDIVPQDDGMFDIFMSALNAKTEQHRASAVLRNVPNDQLLGGIALVSSPPTTHNGARWWFREFETAGEKIAAHPERTFGPIAGTLYSLNGSVLKLSAQLLPVGRSAPHIVSFQRRPAESSKKWQTVAREVFDRGHSVLFRIEEWDATRAWDYRIVYRDENGQLWTYTGRIRADPIDRSELTIGLLSCVIPTARQLEAETYTPEVPEAEFIGRYTPENFHFPHQQLTQNLESHDPDLLVSVGDQIYEDSPTGPVGSKTAVDPRLSYLFDSDPWLDYLYKWYMWIWSFRDVTRSRPTIVLIDDHDVYQFSLWGEQGRTAGLGPQDGGYVGEADFVNRVQRIQCGHNPDPFDPTSIDRGIDVYYTQFKYGRTAFALLEDRKWKTAPPPEHNYPPRLLGNRQEKFLQEWVRNTSNVSAKICLTQTTFACAQTTPNGRANKDFDTNGYPKRARDRALRLLREAGALVLSGDQHLPTLIHHGIDDYTDGIVQFSGPAGASTKQRWFEPKEPLPNGTGHPYTGDFTDAFGNKFRMLAVSNPNISLAEYHRYTDNKWLTLVDRNLNSDGYGIIHVDYDNKQYIIECWPWNVTPSDDSNQFPGWPYRLPFNYTDGRHS